MQDREKKLAIALAVVLVGAFGLPVFESWFLQPLTDARNSLAAVHERVGKLIDSENQLKQAERNLEDWKYESLPPNPYTAQREYQEWLMVVARMSGFAAPVPALPNIPTSRGRTFVEIPVTIQAKATLEQLARFLYHFERVDLLHRVQTLNVISPAAVGNPLFDVTIMARGLSLVDAPERLRLFPATTLREDLTADGETLVVDRVKGFPLVDGFQVKIGEELLTVRKHGEETLTVERGAEQTTAAAHAAGSVVELFPVDRSVFASGRTFEDYLDLVAHSPFTKPAPPMDYKPELSPSSKQIVTRGEPWKLKLNLSGWDSAGGPAVFEVHGDVPPGLVIDARSGELSWNADKNVEARTYDVAVVARSDVLSGQRIQITLPVVLREPNLPPTIESIDSLTAYSGRPLEVAVKSDDPDGDNSALEFALAGTVPAGATIESKTGKLKWVPPLTLELGEYKLSISVSDGGDPKQTTTQEVKVTLEDDAALFTRLVGIFRNGGKPEVMLRNLSSGQTTRMTEGDQVRAADVEGTIVGIETNHIVLKVGEQNFRLEMGNSLRQMTPMDSPAVDPDNSESASG